MRKLVYEVIIQFHWN